MEEQDALEGVFGPDGTPCDYILKKLAGEGRKCFQCKKILNDQIKKQCSECLTYFCGSDCFAEAMMPGSRHLELCSQIANGIRRAKEGFAKLDSASLAVGGQAMSTSKREDEAAQIERQRELDRWWAEREEEEKLRNWVTPPEVALQRLAFDKGLTADVSGALLHFIQGEELRAWAFGDPFHVAEAISRASESIEFPVFARAYLMPAAQAMLVGIPPGRNRGAEWRRKVDQMMGAIEFRGWATITEKNRGMIGPLCKADLSHAISINFSSVASWRRMMLDCISRGARRFGLTPPEHDSGAPLAPAGSIQGAGFDIHLSRCGMALTIIESFAGPFERLSLGDSFLTASVKSVPNWETELSALRGLLPKIERLHLWFDRTPRSVVDKDHFKALLNDAASHPRQWANRLVAVRVFIMSWSEVDTQQVRRALAMADKRALPFAIPELHLRWPTNEQSQLSQRNALTNLCNEIFVTIPSEEFDEKVNDDE